MVRMVIGTLVGAAAGYGWYRVVGCTTGSCWISADPFLSSAYWGLFGWVAGGGGTVLDRLLRRATAALRPPTA